MLRNTEFYVQRQIKEAGGLPEIEQSIQLIEEYLTKDYYKSKNKRLQEWNPDRGEIYELVLAVFTIALSQIHITYQAIVGMVAGRIGVEDHIDQVKIVAEVIALISKTGLIDISRTGSGNHILISTEYEIDSLPDTERHPIRMDRIKPVTKNFDDEFGSLILGGKQNHHDKEICLDHINRMNAIQLKLNKPFLRKYEEAPTFALDTEEKKAQWENFVLNSYRSYIKLVKAGNRFYLGHRYDKRGRCYAEGYHVNTQGSSFKKAIIQLADVELVEG